MATRMVSAHSNSLIFGVRLLERTRWLMRVTGWFVPVFSATLIELSPYLSILLRSHIVLPVSGLSLSVFTGCVITMGDNDSQCRNSRTGYMCGRCGNGTVPSTKLDGTCVKESTSLDVAVRVVLLIFVPLIAVFVFLRINFRMTNSLRGVLFFCFAVPFVFHPTDEYLIELKVRLFFSLQISFVMKKKSYKVEWGWRGRVGCQI